MELVLLLSLSLASGGVVLLVLNRGNRHRLDQSVTAFFMLFPLAGALSVLPGLALYSLQASLLPITASGRWGRVLFIWTVNAPVEELSKYLCFALVASLLHSLREPQDGVLQGAATGLGFGLVENFLYGLAGGWELLLLRSLVSLPGHVIYGAVWGGYHGFEVYQGGGRVARWRIPLLALVPAAFAHAVFNTLVLVQAPLLVTVTGDLLTMGFGLFLFWHLRALSPLRLRRPLRQWRQAIPELEHALFLNPRSITLRRRLAAYLLVANQPDRALVTLEGLADESWTSFYRQAAIRRQKGGTGTLPREADMDPELFRRLSGG